MTVTELEEIVGELYLLPPADFVAARNELVRQARAAGHREFAETLQSPAPADPERLAGQRVGSS